jgi:hypothetical protein
MELIGADGGVVPCGAHGAAAAGGTRLGPAAERGNVNLRVPGRAFSYGRYPTNEIRKVSCADVTNFHYTVYYKL